MGLVGACVGLLCELAWPRRLRRTATATPTGTATSRGPLKQSEKIHHPEKCWSRLWCGGTRRSLRWSWAAVCGRDCLSVVGFEPHSIGTLRAGCDNSKTHCCGARSGSRAMQYKEAVVGANGVEAVRCQSNEQRLAVRGSEVGQRGVGCDPVDALR